MDTSSPLILDVPESNQKDQEKEQEQEQEQNAEDVKRSWHFFCMFLTIFLWYTIIDAIKCQSYFNDIRDGHRSSEPETNSEKSCHDYVKDGTSIFHLPVLPYIIYILECCSSGTCKYLNRDMKVVEYETFVNEMKSARPKLTIKVECYHWETRTRTVYYTDYQGRSQSRFETYREIVITHTDWSFLDLKSWEDVTGDIMGVVEGGSVRLEVLKDYDFGDMESIEKFRKEKNDLIEKNEHRDTYIGEYVYFEIDGYEERVMVQKKRAKEKLCTSLLWYWIWSLLGLSWLYRIWVESNSPKKKITIKKTIYL